MVHVLSALSSENHSWARLTLSSLISFQDLGSVTVNIYANFLLFGTAHTFKPLVSNDQVSEEEERKPQLPVSNSQVRK